MRLGDGVLAVIYAQRWPVNVEEAQRRVAARGAALGFLYVERRIVARISRPAPIPKAHVARLRMPQPGTTDYWVNDAVGEPLLL